MDRQMAEGLIQTGLSWWIGYDTSRVLLGEDIAHMALKLNVWQEGIVALGELQTQDMIERIENGDYDEQIKHDYTRRA